ncbi:hypothetical protein [Paenibacillus dauci]|uniref:hypothetical protein n=1 Tax=Paenibacillus dauci TaxID=1567106 RepID=UPI0018CDA0ED|nr:hypothetical protein [Paenibacillus dauci]
MSITACQSNTSIDQSKSKTEEIRIENSINKNLDLIIANKNTRLSSNPTDYINANKKHYEEITNTGDQGFKFLYGELKQSSNDGLKEWIMAKACEDILKEKKPSIQWTSGKDWLQQYEKIKT